MTNEIQIAARSPQKLQTLKNVENPYIKPPAAMGILEHGRRRHGNLFNYRGFGAVHKTCGADYPTPVLRNILVRVEIIMPSGLISRSVHFD